MLNRILVAFVGFLSLAFPAMAVELITKEEAARPNDPFRPGAVNRRGPYPDPEIRVWVNPVVTSPFNLTVELRPGAKSARINLNSLQITYRKSPPVDLKRRILPFVDSSNRVVVIKLENAEAPPGKHQIVFQVEDSNDLLVTKVLDLEVRSSR